MHGRKIGAIPWLQGIRRGKQWNTTIADRDRRFVVQRTTRWKGRAVSPHRADPDRDAVPRSNTDGIGVMSVLVVFFVAYFSAYEVAYRIDGTHPELDDLRRHQVPDHATDPRPVGSRVHAVNSSAWATT